VSALPAEAPDARADDAAALFERLSTRPGSFELFQALRRIEAAHPDKPRARWTSRCASRKTRR
jgi:predicted component of type VI protein secretion system